MFDPEVTDLWWKNAVVYCVDVPTFMDSDGDGMGELRGLTQRLPYLSGLGVTCLWLLPFYPSPRRDDGYDVSDYYAVHPSMGTLGEFVELVRSAREQGIRIVVDLVVNHTSDQHPWFQSSRSSKDSPYRDWYVWVDEPPEEQQKVIFPDREDSNWAYEEATGQYYLHRFYSSEPTSTSRTLRSARRSTASWASGSSWGCRGSASMPSRTSSRRRASSSGCRRTRTGCCRRCAASSPVVAGTP